MSQFIPCDQRVDIAASKLCVCGHARRDHRGGPEDYDPSCGAAGCGCRLFVVVRDFRSSDTPPDWIRRRHGLAPPRRWRNIRGDRFRGTRHQPTSSASSVAAAAANSSPSCATGKQCGENQIHGYYQGSRVLVREARSFQLAEAYGELAVWLRVRLDLEVC